MAVEAKKDGTPNRARCPRPTGVKISRHENGHVRVYKNGIHSFESYLGTRGEAYVGPRG